MKAYRAERYVNGRWTPLKIDQASGLPIAHTTIAGAQRDIDKFSDQQVKDAVAGRIKMVAIVPIVDLRVQEVVA